MAPEQNNVWEQVALTLIEMVRAAKEAEEQVRKARLASQEADKKVLRARVCLRQAQEVFAKARNFTFTPEQEQRMKTSLEQWDKCVNPKMN